MDHRSLKDFTVSELITRLSAKKLEETDIDAFARLFDLAANSPEVKSEITRLVDMRSKATP